MKRDGALESMWQHSIPDYQPEKKEISTEAYDVLIAGAGLTGILTGLLLQKAGKKCIIAEAHTVGFGTTGGTSAHLNTFFDTPYHRVSKDFGEKNALLLADAAIDAFNLIKQHIGFYSIDCDYEEKPGYIFSFDEKQDKELDELVEGLSQVGLPGGIINSSAFPIPYTKVALVPGQGQYHPVKYLFALAKEFEAVGGTILINARITETKEGEIIKATTDAGEISAKSLIWATHIPPGVNLLHFRAAPYRSYVMGFELNDHQYPEALGYDMMEPYHYYRTHVIDGKKYLTAGGEDHKTAHEENTEECFRRLEAYVRQFYDIKPTAFKWSSQYFEPADGLPYIGRLPGNGDNIYCATGYGGNGMMYSHIAAITFKEIFTEGESRFQKLFDPNRVKPVAGFSNFVKEAADVVKNLVSGKFSAEKIKEFADLAAGEAKVVKYEGDKIAMYKDEQHNIHAVSPVCTHIHCTVSWNSAEKSWDCPCHGARYSADGAVLTGPAVQRLREIEIDIE